jgi:hypothetical protein
MQQDQIKEAARTVGALRKLRTYGAQVPDGTSFAASIIILLIRL